MKNLGRIREVLYVMCPVCRVNFRLYFPDPEKTLEANYLDFHRELLVPPWLADGTRGTPWVFLSEEKTWVCGCRPGEVLGLVEAQQHRFKRIRPLHRGRRGSRGRAIRPRGSARR